jgi:hypothetical protein
MPSVTSPRIPSYRLHKPTGLAVVRLNGRDFYLGKHGSPESKIEYRRLISEWLANHQQPLGPTQNGASDGGHGNVFTINELIVRYWDFAGTYYVKNDQPTRELNNLREAIRPLATLYGPTAAAEFGPLALERVTYFRTAEQTVG